MIRGNASYTPQEVVQAIYQQKYGAMNGIPSNHMEDLYTRTFNE